MARYSTKELTKKYSKWSGYDTGYKSSSRSYGNSSFWMDRFDRDIDLDVEIVRAVNRLANGRAAFGLQGILGKNAQKVRLNSIRVVGGAPDSAVIWGQVADYMALSKTLRQLSIRWNALAVDINIDQVPSNTTAGGKLACSMYGHYLDLKTLVAAEKKLTRATAGIFPHWSHMFAFAFKPV